MLKVTEVARVEPCSNPAAYRDSGAHARNHPVKWPCWSTRRERGRAVSPKDWGTGTNKKRRDAGGQEKETPENSPVDGRYCPSSPSSVKGESEASRDSH